MELELHNINRISSASIEIGGLTLIAGENDSGKSTVGKVLFSFVKALSRQNEDLEEGKERSIFNKIESLFFLLRKRMLTQYIEDDNEFRLLFHPRYFIEELRFFINISEGTSDLAKRELSDLLAFRKDYIFKMEGLSELSKIQLMSKIDEIKELCYKQQDPISTFKGAFKKVIYSEFYSRICSDNEAYSSIKLASNGDSVLVNFSDNRIQSLEVRGMFFRPFDDITFVETPMYLQLTNLIERAGTLFYEDEDKSNRFGPKIPLHIKDLMNKLELNKYASSFNNEYSEFINSVIHGNFHFDRKNNQFLFVSEGCSSPLQPSNVASGIKNFGIIQLLLSVNELNKQKMLIIDEPENHLHPKWQLAFAHLIVKLVRNQIPVMVSSHSPYFIQAIKYYSIKENISEKVKYYLADEDVNNNNMTTITDVTKDLNKIFIKLAEPLNEILRG